VRVCVYELQFSSFVLYASHDDVKLRDHGEVACVRAVGLRMGELCAFTASERVRLYSELNSEWSDVLPHAHAHRPSVREAVSTVHRLR
jgi:hypothetical protein